jgi:molybdopterin molybdotransferase
MVRKLLLGLEEALDLTLKTINPLPVVSVDLLDGSHHALAEDVLARVDSPSIDASLKDGYAVISGEIETATPDHPVTLTLAGHVGAGDTCETAVLPGTAVRILTGAKIPPGANAVVSEEFTTTAGGHLTVFNDAEPGRNILPRGSDVAVGQVLAEKGRQLSPGLLGLIAAAGHSSLAVVRQPKVAIISTGDEVVAPGQPLSEGKLYASNMTTLGCWCRRYSMAPQLAVVRDDADAIESTLRAHAASADAIITSGGAWTGDRDLVAKILERLGWKQVFHRIRIGPGKAVGFGMLADKPVFILPGGPPSNLMGFLQIALPGLLKLAGHHQTGLPTLAVQLDDDLVGRYADWTQFYYGSLTNGAGVPVFHSLENKSRLRSMAEAQAVVDIAEGQTRLAKGEIVRAQLLR